MSAPTYLQIRDFLKKCNLLEYYDRFMSEGFDQLQSLLDVTEADLMAMDVKRGHRRRLQREIATMKGIPSNVPLPLFLQHGSGFEDSNDGHSLNINVPQKILYINGPPSSNCGSSQSGGRSARVDDPPDPPDPPDNGSTKRKYKRHPKRDKNAPVKPLSAYVMFAHKVREEYNGRNIPFPDMAKIVGDRWKNISPEEKDLYETNASKKKEEYQAKMAMYKTTEHWRKYQEYLKEFKEKYESNSRDQSKPRKKFKSDQSPDSDNTRSGYSSTRSTSVGYDNGSGNISSGSSNGNGNGGHNSQHQFSTGPYFNHGYSNYSPNSTNYIPPYPHINPTVYGYTNEQNIGNSFVTPPPSIINTSNNSSAPSTTLADLYAKDDSSAGDDQSQQESSGNGNGSSSFGGMGSSSSRSVEGQNSEDSSDSTGSSNDTNDTNDTPPAVTLEIDDSSQSQQQSSQHDNSASSCKQKDAKD